MGYSYARFPEPLDSGFVPLGDLSIILGPNDSGKSHILGHVWRDLRRLDLEPERPGVHRIFDDRGAVLFAELEPEEFARTMAQLVADLYPASTEPDSLPPGEPSWEVPALPGERFLWRLGVWDGERLDDATLDREQAPGRAWITALRDALPEPDPGWDRILAALSGSRLLGFETEIDWDPVTGRGPPVWNVYWCLPRLGDLPGQLAVDLRESGLHQFADPSPGEKPMEHLVLEGAPVMIAPIGRTDLPLMPMPVTVPAQFGDLRQGIEDAIGAIVETTRRGRIEVEAIGADALQFKRRPGKDVWVNWSEDGKAISLHPDAEVARALLEASANALLPSYVGERYEIGVVIAPLVHWLAGDPIDVELRGRDGEAVFPVGKIADGHRVWVQLALLEAIDDLQRLLAALQATLSGWGHLQQQAQMIDPEEADAQREAELLADKAFERYEQFVDAFRSGEGFRLAGSPSELSATVYKPSQGQLTQFERRMLMAIRPRLYLIDEPEQHLHPRLQRAAARWLVDTVRQRRSQCIVTTHSVPFLNLGPGASFAYVSRGHDQRARVHGLEPHLLTRLSEEASELGFDRGELLGLVSVFLFVEGRADQRVIEALFARELHRDGIAVVPIHGFGRWKGILDADALLRFTAAKVAVWLDNVPSDVVAKLKGDREFREAARGNRELSEETRAMASLMLTAQAVGKGVEPVPHPGRDILDLLDPVVLRDVGVVSDQYPGHAKASQIWQEHRQATGANAGEKKAFYRQRFGLRDDVADFVRAADEMARRELRPSELVEVIEACGRLAWLP